MDTCTLFKTLSLFLWQAPLSLSVCIEPGLEKLLPTSKNTELLESSVLLTRALLEAGYHRTLITTVHHQSPEVGGQLILAQNITRDMYLDIDQLSTLNSLTGEPQLIVSEHMNTEQPASLSTHHLTLVYLSPASSYQSRVPVHFRYQSSCDREYIPVTIPPPFLLLYQPQSAHDLSHISLPCNSTTTLLCDWSQLTYTLEEDCETTRIPCGDETNTLVVVTVTLTVTLLAAVSLCVSIVSSVKHQSSLNL